MSEQKVQTAQASALPLTPEISGGVLGNLPTLEVKTAQLVDPKVLGEAGMAAVAKRVGEKRLSTMSTQELALWGSGRQKALGEKLDVLLTQVNRKDSPIIFELFDRVKKGVKEANLSEIEAAIRKSLDEPWYGPVLNFFGLGDKAKQIQEMQERFQQLISAKAKTLQELTSNMEADLEKEVYHLIEDGVRLEHQIGEFRTNVFEYAIDVVAGKKLLEDAQEDDKRMRREAEETKDPLKAQAVRDFTRRYQSFQSRVLVLQEAYVDSPMTLEMLGGIQGAEMATLSETANSSLQDFNKIKSLLLMLTSLYKTKSLQAMNDQRRMIKQKLQQFAIELYDDVAVTAAKAQGDNRLEDAQIALSIATALENVGNKVQAAYRENNEKFAQAEQLLIQAKEKILQIGFTEEKSGGSPFARY